MKGKGETWNGEKGGEGEGVRDGGQSKEVQDLGKGGKRQAHAKEVPCGSKKAQGK